MSLDKYFDKLVVVMFENRSLDNLLGYLYENDQPDHVKPSGSSPNFNGVAGKDLSNAYSLDGKEFPPVPVSKAPHETMLDMIQPFPDPGETYPNIFRQQYNKLFQEGEPIPSPGAMKGFINDYINAVQTTEGWDNVPDNANFDYTKIMRCFTPQALPVMSKLALGFAISDEWFCSVPSQTFTNRSFFHSAQANGFVNNPDYIKWLDNTAPTIFNRLSDSGRSWQVLWDEQDRFGSMTRLLQPALYPSKFNSNFVGYKEESITNLLAGDLPDYTFIEPRLLFNHNDMHPSVWLNPDIASSVLAGEILLKRIYDGVRNNPDRDRILLAVVFDEAGGTYDHVWPHPDATPPNPGCKGEDGFGFNRFGIRVPAIFISSHINAKTVVRSPRDTPFDHTSIIKTICNRWGLPHLTDRDAAAPDIGSVFDDSASNDWPEVQARPVEPISEPILNHSLASGLKRHLVEALIKFTECAAPDPNDVMAVVRFLEEAAKELEKIRGKHHCSK